MRPKTKIRLLSTLLFIAGFAMTYFAAWKGMDHWSAFPNICLCVVFFGSGAGCLIAIDDL